MAVHVQVRWKVVGDGEVEFASEFGRLAPVEDETKTERTAPVERVLEPESSAIASGLAVQFA